MAHFVRKKNQTGYNQRSALYPVFVCVEMADYQSNNRFSVPKRLCTPPQTMKLFEMGHPGLGYSHGDFVLSVARLRSVTMHEVVRGPGSGELHPALLQFQRGGRVFILVALHRLVIDQVCDIQ